MLQRQTARCGTVVWPCLISPLLLQPVECCLSCRFLICVGIASTWTENKDQLKNTKRKSKDYAWQKEVSQQLSQSNTAHWSLVRPSFERMLAVPYAIFGQLLYTQLQFCYCMNHTRVAHASVPVPATYTTVSNMSALCAALLFTVCRPWQFVNNGCYLQYTGTVITGHVLHVVPLLFSITFGYVLGVCSNCMSRIDNAGLL